MRVLPKTTNVVPLQRKISRDQRRQQLIDATMRVLSRKGYAQTTLSNVALEAGVSHGLVNFHFESKEKLLTATLLFLSDEYRNNWVAALETAGDARRRTSWPPCSQPISTMPSASPNIWHAGVLSGAKCKAARFTSRNVPPMTIATSRNWKAFARQSLWKVATRLIRCVSPACCGTAARDYGTTCCR